MADVGDVDHADATCRLRALSASRPKTGRQSPRGAQRPAMVRGALGSRQTGSSLSAVGAGQRNQEPLHAGTSHSHLTDRPRCRIRRCAGLDRCRGCSPQIDPADAESESDSARAVERDTHIAGRSRCSRPPTAQCESVAKQPDGVWGRRSLRRRWRIQWGRRSLRWGRFRRRRSIRRWAAASAVALAVAAVGSGARAGATSTLMQSRGKVES